MSDVVIKVENLGKKYRIRHQQQERYTALRDVLARKLSAPFRKLTQARASVPQAPGSAAPAVEDFWALKDVNFEVKRGEVVGIIGRNGAGKSTLLKILSRITEPTRGELRIHGRVSSLLEVGTGFHPELTGRENIFLNGAVLGMKRAEIRQKFDEIVAFAEVEKFLDTPVKHYSSGMYVRLAFAVAAHLQPDILIVDEVLAVGDAEFQRKCLGKMKEVSDGKGRTVLFVSHNMQAVQSLCRKALLLKNGAVCHEGSAAEATAHYLLISQDTPKDAYNRQDNSHRGPLSVERASLVLKGDQPNLRLEVSITIKSSVPHPPAFIALDISDSTGTAIMQALPRTEPFIQFSEVPAPIPITINLPPLIPGTYFVGIWVGPHNNQTFDEVTSAMHFTVLSSPSAGRTFPHTRDHGWIVPSSIIR